MNEDKEGMTFSIILYDITGSAEEQLGQERRRRWTQLDPQPRQRKARRPLPL